MSDATTVSEMSETEVDAAMQMRSTRLRRRHSSTLESVVAETHDEIDPIDLPDTPEKPRKTLKRKRAKPKPKPKPKLLPRRGPEPMKPAKRRVWNDQGEPSDSESETNSDDEALDALPDYVKKRRAAFRKRHTKLKDAGLRLPPSFEEIDFSDDEDLAHLKEKPDFPIATPVRPYKDIPMPKSLGVVPASIAQWLRDYQVVGAEFLHQKFVYQEGGILGDDMGLGKTIQVISFLTAAFGKTGDERDGKRMRKMRRRLSNPWYPRILIVCPGTLIENWKAELDRWGYWHVDVFHGDTKETAIAAAQTGRLEIMITTYTTYRERRDTINMVKWDAVIADECHIIKGRKSETTKAMNEINALCRIGLTGTAIQNTYDELWTLLNWTSPGLLGSARSWKQLITDPLRQGQAHGATLRQLGHSRSTAEKLTRHILPKFFLRRMKTLIADQLPKKSDRVVFCALTETQSSAYEEFLGSESIELIKSSGDPCDCGLPKKKRGWCCHQKSSDGRGWLEYVFPCVMALQKMANHLAILIPQDADKREKQEKDLKLLQDALPEQWRKLMETRASIMHYANPEFCGKWKVLKKLLRFWHDNGDKVLIFSHSVRLLKMLRMLFQSTAYNVSFLDGSMSLDDRAKEVDAFNADSEQFVFLISTKAGGVGLNITSANKVVVFDPNWNPAYDLQAQDRAYRIGQTRDVEVFRLVSSGTIEEIVYARQIYKQQQANIGYTASKERRYFAGVQEAPGQKGEIFGLKNLFAYQGENIVLRDIVNRTNIAESKAGVAVADVDLSQTDENGDPLFSSQDDDEDGAISQMAKMIAKGETNLEASARRKKNTPKVDPIQAILAEAGVEYTHENSEVIGSSKVEARISRKAAAAGENFSQGEKHAFANTQERKGDGPDTTAGEGTDEEPDKVKWLYNPPEDVKKRQFCSMAKTFGFESAEQFALVVEGWTQEQRRNALDRFYLGRRAALSQAAADVDRFNAAAEVEGAI